MIKSGVNRPTAATGLSEGSKASAPRPFSRGALVVLLGLACVLLIAWAHSPRRSPLNPDDLILEPAALLPAGADGEVSGMVPSLRHPHIYWTVGDSGNAASIYPVRLQPGLPSKAELPSNANAATQLPPAPGISVTNAANRDWEDITRDAQGHLIIADLGNNSNARKDLCLYFVDEPDLNAPQTAAARKLVLEYPDQTDFPSPRDHFNFDAEAVFTIGDAIYVLTKHRSDTFTSMYKVTDPASDQASSLEYVDRFDVKGQVTGATASDDGLKLAVLTYNRIWLFARQSTLTPFFAAKVSSRTYRYAHGASVSESICFEDSNTLLITDEVRASVARV
ncbi:MAG: hypothetical protein NTV94_09535, partial [Planctomycetota bacterium]|nr:hypothetical protein [Planctomycetota bacterium]